MSVLLEVGDYRDLLHLVGSDEVFLGLPQPGHVNVGVACAPDGGERLAQDESWPLKTRLLFSPFSPKNAYAEKSDSSFRIFLMRLLFPLGVPARFSHLFVRLSTVSISSIRS